MGESELTGGASITSSGDKHKAGDWIWSGLHNQLPAPLTPEACLRTALPSPPVLLGGDGSHPVEPPSRGTAFCIRPPEECGPGDPPHGALDSATGVGGRGEGWEAGAEFREEGGTEKRQRVEARTKVLEVSREGGEGKCMEQKHRPRHPDRREPNGINPQAFRSPVAELPVSCVKLHYKTVKAPRGGPLNFLISRGPYYIRR